MLPFLITTEFDDPRSPTISKLKASATPLDCTSLELRIMNFLLFFLRVRIPLTFVRVKTASTAGFKFTLNLSIFCSSSIVIPLISNRLSPTTNSEPGIA